MDIAVLIGVVKQNNLWRVRQLKQVVDATATISVNSYMKSGKLVPHLEGLVAKVVGCRGSGGYHKTFAASLVATA